MTNTNIARIETKVTADFIKGVLIDVSTNEVLATTTSPKRNLKATKIVTNELTEIATRKGYTIEVEEDVEIPAHLLKN